MGFIYKITSPSGKVYVGQTIQRFEARMKSHRSKGSRCTAVRNAIKKYGDDKMVWDIIEEVPNELLDEREIFWIKELNCLSPNGYNLMSGGNVNREVSQFTKDNMSLAARSYAFEKNGYVGCIENTSYGFCPRIKVGGKNVQLSDGPCKTKDEAIEILNEYARDPEHFVKREGSAKYKAKGVSFNKFLKKWQVYGKGEVGKYLGVYETKDEAEKIYEEYLKDPEHFVRPGNIMRKKGTGCVCFDKRRKKWRAIGKGGKYIGIYKTKEEAESALDEYNNTHNVV